MYQKILLSIAIQNWNELTPHAKAARDVAISIARGSGKGVNVLTVYDHGKIAPSGLPPEHAAAYVENQRMDIDRQVEEKIKSFTAPIEQEGIEVTKILKVGSPREEIVKTAKEIGADVIIIGSHSKRGFFDVLLGGTAQVVCSRASCPVIMVSPRIA